MDRERVWVLEELREGSESDQNMYKILKNKYSF